MAVAFAMAMSLVFALVVVHFQSHPVVYFVVLQRDVVLVYVVPLLNADLLPFRA